MKANMNGDAEQRPTWPVWGKKPYKEPYLQRYGSVAALTAGGGSPGVENATGNPMMPCSSNTGMSCLSDRTAKENVTRIGAHPLGIGLYLFDYKAEYRKVWGHGRQFGVMADEVEEVMPEAVSMGPDGYKKVNYAMLAIHSTLQ
jgi:hypothetical protein